MIKLRKLPGQTKQLTVNFHAYDDEDEGNDHIQCNITQITSANVFLLYMQMMSILERCYEGGRLTHYTLHHKGNSQ